MKKLFVILLILFVANCSTKKLENKHGLINLEKKKTEITIGKTNKNDVMNIFGPPSTVSTFDDNIWIYIESKKVNQSIFKLGSKKLKKNNTLILHFNNRGLVKKYEFVDIQNMNEINVSKNETQKSYSKQSKLYTILTSLREKINAPTRRNKIKKNK